MAGCLDVPEQMQAVTAVDAQCVLGDRAVPAPAGRQVLVRIRATAVNRADTLQRKGSYNPPPGETDVLGLEMAGEVVSTGPDCEGSWAAGDRVMALLGSGGYAQFVAVDERQLMAAPADFSWEQAAAVPETWLTAFQLLHLIAGVQPGDRVLIHAAASGVGTAATQLALAAGATVFATAGSQSKLDFLTTTMGVTAAFNYKTQENWGELVAEAAGGGGVSIILDCVGASHWANNVAAIAPEGRWVLYGLMGGVEVPGNVLGHVLRKRLRIEGTTLRARPVEYKANLVARFAELALPKFADGSFTVVVDRTFPLAEAQQAHDYIESNASVGKVVMVV